MHADFDTVYIYKAYLEWKKYNNFKILENLEKYLNTYILKAFSINLKSILDNNQNPVFCGALSEKLSKADGSDDLYLLMQIFSS